ncbi:hypothetical protein G6F16_008662 [Rhizopus arrhizus]|nr:hypothetical protein G6F23_009430 [Rhizopus arrhizus]KAG0761387.1 hypothetical protein G6F24_007604 [Rhizopus arrhizus]KAG0787970.1 hypothetical protein G6F21_007543 [Rhizopus arrhizus]KAG0798761.1 hypothetical protein G6F22_003902 [Rhizopus arrhizus]KAG0809525.1 hypothetical protein G6F20_008707 [Rhizopus arrhizus]
MKDSFVLSAITIFTISICGLLTRWHFQITFVKPSSNTFISGLMSHGISLCLVLVAILSQSTSNYIFSFSFAITGALWYLSGPYLVRRWMAISSSLLISSLVGYLACYSSKSFFLSTLTFQNWLAFSFLLVVACNAVDHLDAILNTYPHLVTCDKSKQAKLQNAFTATYWIAMFKLVSNMPSETELHSGPIDDLNTAIRALGPASRSWKTMAALFPSNLRQDLCLLYAFFRTADDLVDDAPTPKECEDNLVTIRQFLRDVFYNAESQEKMEINKETDPSLPSHINWDHYASLLPNKDVLAIFRNFARISHYLCPRAMFELTEAWELDLRGRPIKKQNDLLRYAALISGTFGELCTCVIMYKTGRGNWGGRDKLARKEDVLSRARATGQCLQLINIARDIIADSFVGRCYVPLQYMPNPPQAIYHLLKVARNPMQVGEGTLKSFALRILSLADQISEKAQKGIEGLPDEVQDSIRAAFEIYMAIGPTLRNDPGFPVRAKVPKRQQQWIALRCIYGFRGPIARAFSSIYYQATSFYFDSFARLSTRPTPKSY